MTGLRGRSDSRSAAILFGSRAEGTSHLLSDFDVLYITDIVGGHEEPRRLASQHCVDLFILTLDELDDAVETGNSILYDALTRGEVLYDSLGIVDQLQSQVRDVTEKRGLERTDTGWRLEKPR